MNNKILNLQKYYATTEDIKEIKEIISNNQKHVSGTLDEIKNDIKLLEKENKEVIKQINKLEKRLIIFGFTAAIFNTAFQSFKLPWKQ